MYKCSTAFHDAVREGNKQMPLLIFRDAVFTETDIDVDTGIEFDDNFNMEENLAIGQVTANEIRFSLFNDDRLLNNYEFGEFTALLGVLLRTRTYVQRGTTMVVTQRATYIGNNEEPYLQRDGTAVAVQPTFPVAALLGYDGKVWAFSADGQYKVYNDATGADVTEANPVNAFMLNKSLRWAGMGIFYNASTRFLAIYRGGTCEQYEFVPLGVFDAERPNVPDQIRIDIRAYDRMKKFDDDMPSAEELGISYPTTLRNLRNKLCDYVDVPYRTASFINQNATADDPATDSGRVTMRTVLGWIAEAAGSNARFDRDGYLVMDWLRFGQDDEPVLEMDEHDYTEFGPYWYRTKAITKLCNRNTRSGEDTVLGDRKQTYLIQDNPFLAGAT